MINKFFFLMLLSQLIASTSQVLLKKSAEKEYPSVIREYLNVLVIVGYGLLCISLAISILCYKKLGYMGVVIIEPIGYIIVTILSRFIFKEKMTPRKTLGMICILGGIAVFFGLG